MGPQRQDPSPVTSEQVVVDWALSQAALICTCFDESLPNALINVFYSLRARFPDVHYDVCLYLEMTGSDELLAYAKGERSDER
jgi:hypothetical protein